MNCKHVQELLPLYVGRDLEEKRARLVTAHLQTCAECAGSAHDYRETRQLLQQFTPPAFSEAVYAGIRQRVLGEIERESPGIIAPTLTQFVSSLFRPRIRWAGATALLVIVSVFAFYLIGKRTGDRRGGQQLADSGSRVRPTLSAIKKSQGLPPANAVPEKGPVQGLAGGTHQYQRRSISSAAAKRTGPATVNDADSGSMIVEASRETNNLAEPDAGAARDSATSGKILRVEMQTRDPNIRIIWFVHQPTKQDSPGKFSKGT